VGDHLTMGYFDNLDNGFSNKYEKNLKNKKILWICSSTYRIDGDSIFMQFHHHLILHQGPSKFYTICNGYNLTDLTVFDGLSNDHEIA
jgi:hypothetical protein